MAAPRPEQATVSPVLRHGALTAWPERGARGHVGGGYRVASAPPAYGVHRRPRPLYIRHLYPDYDGPGLDRVTFIRALGHSALQASPSSGPRCPTTGSGHWP